MSFPAPLQAAMRCARPGAALRVSARKAGADCAWLLLPLQCTHSSLVVSLL